MDPGTKIQKIEDATWSAMIDLGYLASLAQSYFELPASIGA
ncbi:unnamed protein product [Acidithrix sp. C25]|nr:unnamed protein product [Acidithrix sp. C25]